MGRRRSGGRSSGGRSSSFRPAASRKAPAPAPGRTSLCSGTSPRQAGSLMGGIGSAIADGLSFGAGISMAHRAVDAIFGPRTIKHETVATTAPAADSATMATNSSLGGSDACGVHMKAFQDCLNTSGSDISKCPFYMDMLSECRKNSDAGLAA
ncbi:hypothetical protein ACH5RR_026995 [Cinchona calisaya]|uniref:CHCH domain-containing protein n=1 Tax=Cinchona calisaya TaxID=153742 RepID=A0ABD2Z958_9GENT